MRLPVSESHESRVLSDVEDKVRPREDRARIPRAQKGGGRGALPGLRSR